MVMDSPSQSQGKCRGLPPKPQVSGNGAEQLNLLTPSHCIHHLVYSLAGSADLVQRSAIQCTKSNQTEKCPAKET